MRECKIDDLPEYAWIQVNNELHQCKHLFKTQCRILDDGTGWVLYVNEWIPATFYLEDILYRLDLQGKLL